MRLLLSILFVLFALGSATVTFEGHQVLRVIPKNEAHLQILQQHSKPQHGMDFWTDVRGINQPVDIRVPPHAQASFSQMLKDAGMTVSVFVRDVQELVDNQHTTTNQANFYAQYHNLADITTWMKQLVAQNPKLVTFTKIGTSYEGRDLNILTISASSGSSAPKTAIWIDGCIHAREWITTATLLYMTGTLIDQYKANNQTVVNLLKNMVIYVMPVFNVDGYAYTWTTNRMWRKTRSANSGSSCLGTDPNRNWDWHWGEAGADPDPCSESFYGASPFSEIEVRTVADYIWKHADTIRGYINFHSYSQLWMSPWGYTSDLPKDYQTQNDLSKACVDALTDVHGTSYQYGPIASTIYPASGSSADWTYGNSSVIYSYGVELRDQGQYGFVLPAREIIPSGEETYAALLVFAQTVLSDSTRTLKQQAQSLKGVVRVN